MRSLTTRDESDKTLQRTDCTIDNAGHDGDISSAVQIYVKIASNPGSSLWFLSRMQLPIFLQQSCRSCETKSGVTGNLYFLGKSYSSPVKFPAGNMNAIIPYSSQASWFENFVNLSKCCPAHFLLARYMNEWILFLCLVPRTANQLVFIRRPPPWTPILRMMISRFITKFTKICATKIWSYTVSERLNLLYNTETESIILNANRRTKTGEAWERGGHGQKWYDSRAILYKIRIAWHMKDF